MGFGLVCGGNAVLFQMRISFSSSVLSSIFRSWSQAFNLSISILTSNFSKKSYQFIDARIFKSCHESIFSSFIFFFSLNHIQLLKFFSRFVTMILKFFLNLFFLCLCVFFSSFFEFLTLFLAKERKERQKKKKNTHRPHKQSSNIRFDETVVFG